MANGMIITKINKYSWTILQQNYSCILIEHSPPPPRVSSVGNQKFQSLTRLVDVAEENFRRDKPSHHHAHQQKHPPHPGTVRNRTTESWQIPCSPTNILLLLLNSRIASWPRQLISFNESSSLDGLELHFSQTDSLSSLRLPGFQLGYPSCATTRVTRRTSHYTRSSLTSHRDSLLLPSSTRTDIYLYIHINTYKYI